MTCAYYSSVYSLQTHSTPPNKRAIQSDGFWPLRTGWWNMQEKELTRLSTQKCSAPLSERKTSTAAYPLAEVPSWASGGMASSHLILDVTHGTTRKKRVGERGSPGSTQRWAPCQRTCSQSKMWPKWFICRAVRPSASTARRTMCCAIVVANENQVSVLREGL